MQTGSVHQEGPSKAASCCKILVESNEVIPQTPFSTSDFKKARADGMQIETQSAASKAPPGEGDWICPKCNFVNYARRLQCNACNTDQPGYFDSESTPDDGLAASQRPPADFHSYIPIDENDLGDYKSTKKEIAIPRFAAGTVIGKGGSNIKRMQNLTGALIMFKPDSGDRDFRHCVVSGTSKMVAAATEEIERVVEADRAEFGSRDQELKLVTSDVVSEQNGDWVCKSCNNNNFSRRSSCNRCGATRSAPPDDSLPDELKSNNNENGGLNEGMPEPSHMNDNHGSNLQDGDWVCPDCSNHNFAKRYKCNRCQRPRPAPPGAPGGPGGPPINYGEQEGEWVCKSCNNVNFARRFSCNRCQLPRPGGGENGVGQFPRSNPSGNQYGPPRGGGGIGQYASSGQETDRFRCPAEQCGLVIGKGGENIRDIQMRSGANVQLDRNFPPGASEKYFDIRGTREQIEARFCHPQCVLLPFTVLCLGIYPYTLC